MKENEANQKQIDQFAKATSDYQWIHVDTERAKKEMPDGKTIAHGYLIISLIPSLTNNFNQITKWWYSEKNQQLVKEFQNNYASVNIEHIEELKKILSQKKKIK